MVQKIVHQVLPPARHRAAAAAAAIDRAAVPAIAAGWQCSQCNDLQGDLRKVAAMISGTHMLYSNFD